MASTYFAIYILDIVALIFLFGLLHYDNLLGNNRKIAFSYSILFVIIVILAEYGTILASGADIEMRTFNILCNILGFSLSPIIPICLIAIFDINILKKFKLLLLPTLLNTFIVVLSPFFGMIFYVDINNHYQRGSVFFIFVVVYIINILLLTTFTLYIGHKHFHSIKYRMFLLTVFVIAGSCIQLIFPFIYSSWHCVTLSLFLLYISISEFDGSFDSLTKLQNRGAFERASKKINGKKPYSVIILDIDKFKEINDNYGHEYGDLVLIEVASIIRKSFDNNCSCYRIGGDEFCVIRRDADHDELKLQLKFMANNLGEIRKEDKLLPTVSYGYSFFNGFKNFTFKEILKQADNQMYLYKHKTAGK